MSGGSLTALRAAWQSRWFEALAAWARAERERNPSLAFAGDFNVAPEDRDVHDPKRWAGQISPPVQR